MILYHNRRQLHPTSKPLNPSIVVPISHCPPANLCQTQTPFLNMLLKFLGCRNHNPGIRNVSGGEKPLILQIIHAGGVVERYYTAFPAALIIDKYPNFVLARPEIFRRPWDSIVPPEEILVPGKKYFVVPAPTVKKLRQRLRKPIVEIQNGLSCHDHDDVASSESLVNGFNGVDDKSRDDSGEKKIDKKSYNGRRLKKNGLRFSPSLTVIYETQAFDD